jgi:hypothetical protein
MESDVNAMVVLLYYRKSIWYKVFSHVQNLLAVPNFAYNNA